MIPYRPFLRDTTRGAITSKNSSQFQTMAAISTTKSELMLMRRATASLISYAVCLGRSPNRPISAKIHSKCASQPKMVKNSLKIHILGV